jgi:hypothetical protein
MSYNDLTTEQREIDAVVRNFHKSLLNSHTRGVDVSGPAFTDLVKAMRWNIAKLPIDRVAFWELELEHLGIS